MNEKEVGEYVRTNKGYIAKIIEVSPRFYWCDNIVSKNSGIPEYAINIEDENNIILKHSKELIDLVQIEDILKIKEENTIFYIGFTNDFTEAYSECIEKIKSGKLELLEILTKEQFSANSYKVGE
ncbi:MAG: hypothetical protein K1W33_07050 [Clostridia bacterium]